VNRINDLIGNYMIPGFIRFLSSNGYTAGITIVQAAYGCTWTMFHNNAQGNYSDSSGEAFDYRAGALWAGCGGLSHRAAGPRADARAAALGQLRLHQQYLPRTRARSFLPPCEPARGAECHPPRSRGQQPERLCHELPKL